jgi:hypothetical protein
LLRSQVVPAIAVWASGVPTGKALKWMAQIILERDEANAIQTISKLLAATVDQELVFIITRRACVKGAGQFWLLCHQPAIKFPVRAFLFADPTLGGADRDALLSEILCTSCKGCLGTYGADLQCWLRHRCQAVGRVRAIEEVSAGITCAAKVTPVAGHIVERFHGETHKDTRASKCLGASLGPVELSTTQILRRTKQLHTVSLAEQDARGMKRKRCASAGGRTDRAKKRGPYLGPKVRRLLAHLAKTTESVIGANTSKISSGMPALRTNGYILFRREYNRREWPQYHGIARFSKPNGNKGWLRKVSAAWERLLGVEKAWYRQKAVQENILKVGSVEAHADDAPAAAATLPWQVGCKRFPITVMDLLGFSQHDYVGSCKLIRNDSELAARIETLVRSLGQDIPCWRKGYCIGSCKHSLFTMVHAHKVLQHAFLGSFGRDVCRSGDALLYFRGWCKDSGEGSM